jgi:hypothetical protein
MSSFDSTKIALPDIIKDIGLGKVQLPDFQRGWVWDDAHVRSLLVSVARSFPVGAVMLLETGGGKRPPRVKIVAGKKPVLRKKAAAVQKKKSFYSRYPTFVAATKKKSEAKK